VPGRPPPISPPVSGSGNGRGFGRTCPNDGGLIPGLDGIEGLTSGREGLTPGLGGHKGFVPGLDGKEGFTLIGGFTLGLTLSGGMFGRVVGRLGRLGLVVGRSLFKPPGPGMFGSLLPGWPIPMEGRSLPSDGSVGLLGSVDGRVGFVALPGKFGRTDGVVILGFVLLGRLAGFAFPNEGRAVEKLGF